MKNNFKFRIGQEVIIMSHACEYGGRFNTCFGKIMQARETRSGSIIFGIAFSGYKNPASNDGLFWYSANSFKPTNEYAKLLLNRCYGFASRFEVKRIIFNGAKTIVLWADGSKTIATCGVGDQFDPYAGFCAAVTKKLYGSTSRVKKILAPYHKQYKAEVSIREALEGLLTV